MNANGAAERTRAEAQRDAYFFGDAGLGSGEA